MLETTIAGSLPKPAWLAKPRMLWAPWQLEGEALVEARSASPPFSQPDSAVHRDGEGLIVCSGAITQD